MGWGGVGAGRGVARERRTRGVGVGLNGLWENWTLVAAEAAANYHQLGNALSARAHVSLGAQQTATAGSAPCFTVKVQTFPMQGYMV